MDERREEKKAQEKRNAANNAEAIRNAADVAIASKNPYGVAAGVAAKAADKITDGKASKALGEGLAKANELAGPVGQHLQNGINNFNESGLSNRAGQAARMFNGLGGTKSRGSELAKQPTGNNMDTIGRGRDEPSSSLNNASVKPGTANSNTPDENDDNKEIEEDTPPRIAGIGAFGKQPGNRKNEKNDESQDSDNDSNSSFSFFGSKKAKIIISISIIFSVLFFMIIIILVAAASTLFGGNFEDALGAAKASGEDMGTSEFYDGGTKDSLEYYDRINNVKLTLQAQGKTLDATKVAAVFHVLIENGAAIEYKDITEDKITEVANAMFSGSTFDREHFKQELSTRIVPKYLPTKTDDEIDDIVAEIDQYNKDYYEYIEKEEDTSSSYYSGESSCSSGGNCQYDIKGFYVNNSNVSKSLQLNNLKVRLMQCGSPYGNGNDNTPINQDLVNFEDYVAGVAYAELGDGQPVEAYKAQMVMARSFALSRPAAMGNANGKKLSQENGQWVLQIASCVSDQVFCDVDKGCSYMGGGDGQGGYVVSGTNAPGAARSRGPLPANSNLRKAMSTTKGEVITNSQGYIMHSGYNSSSQNNMINMARSGLDYKQILFKTVPNAKNIDKMTCSGEINCKVSTGEYVNWKQCGASWSNVPMGYSRDNICGIGCLVTSISMLISKSGVQTNIPNFNPGTFVEYLNAHGGFADGGNFLWASATNVAPSFKWQGKIELAGKNQQQKFDAIKYEVDNGGYLACEVAGRTGQHWVAVDSISGNQIMMLDPGTNANNMWQQYNWTNTTQCSVYKVG